MAVSIKSKIVPGKDLGNPSEVKSLPEGQSRLIMGVVFGEIVREVTRTMPTGEIYEGFGGTFEAIPAKDGAPTIRSGVLYLPKGFDELLREPFRTALKDDADARLSFGFEVAAVKAGNPQGYEWQYTPLGEPAKADPLAGIRAQIMQTATPQIENKSAPAKPVAKGGKK